MPANSPKLGNLEAIPLIDFRGSLKPLTNSDGAERLALTAFGLELPIAHEVAHSASETTGAAFPWGLDQYVQVGLLPRLRVPSQVQEHFGLEHDWWLAIYHHPQWRSKKALVHGRILIIPELAALSLSYLPLPEKQLQRLQRGLYTARFRVQKNRARRVEAPTSTGVPLPGVDDGDYEVWNGRAYRIAFGGNSTLLPLDHPLVQRPLLATLFNAGIDFSPEQLRLGESGNTLPRRISYFRQGALRVMNQSIFETGNATTKRLEEIEREMHQRNPSHCPFVDRGPPPLVDGKLDSAWMQEHALLVPTGKTLLLGDNHARSGDSREFGFVPQKNIQGTPLCTFWPLSSAFKSLHRPTPPFWTIYRCAVWAIALGGYGSYRLLRRRQMRQLAMSRPWKQS